jgi:hypothetical protein
VEKNVVRQPACQPAGPNTKKHKHQQQPQPSRFLVSFGGLLPLLVQILMTLLTREEWRTVNFAVFRLFISLFLFSFLIVYARHHLAGDLSSEEARLMQVEVDVTIVAPKGELDPTDVFAMDKNSEQLVESLANQFKTALNDSLHNVSEHADA